MRTRPAWWDWIWRRLNAAGDCQGDRLSWSIDVGYCLDRYSIEDADGNVTLSRP